MANDKLYIYAEGIVYMSVCVPKEWDKNTVERQVNTIRPTGLKFSEWEVAEENFNDGVSNPCQCHDDPDKQHWLLTC